MVEIKNIQKWVSASCSDLELEFFLNYTIEFANGQKAVVTAFIPNLGSKIGTIVMGSTKELHELEQKTQLTLQGSGYGYSVLWDQEVSYNREATIEMFSEWGWGGPENDKPAWMIDIEYDEDVNSLI